MKTCLLAAFVLLAGRLDSYSEIVLSDTPQVVVENYRSTPANSSLIVGRNSTFSDIQWATGFTTGDEPALLHSALFLYNGAWYGTTGGFKFALHSDNSGLPGELIAVLDGPDRPVNGITWYEATEQLELEADTVYWLVASAIQTESPRYFEWRGTGSGDEISNLAGWELLDYGARRFDQGAWESYDRLGHTAVKVQAVPGPELVSIDIKPGSYPNSINLDSKGVIPVAFLSDQVFDALTIDPMTVTTLDGDFSNSLVKVTGKKNPKPLASAEDVDGDGDIDLLVKIDTQKLMEFGFYNRTLYLYAMTYDGDMVAGADSVELVPDAGDYLFDSGSGTEEDPWIILNAEDLQAMKYDLDAHYALGAGIDATVTTNWNDGLGFKPVGRSK